MQNPDYFWKKLICKTSNLSRVRSKNLDNCDILFNKKSYKVSIIFSKKNIKNINNLGMCLIELHVCFLFLYNLIRFTFSLQILKRLLVNLTKKHNFMTLNGITSNKIYINVIN